jgi:hypothetical protein
VPETSSVDYENRSDVKGNDKYQHGLLMENQYDNGPSFPSFQTDTI